jgi:rod shape-determining protein MreD
MNLAIGLPLLVLSVMLQGSVLPWLRVRGGQPDLVLLIVVSWSLLGKNVEGLAWAFAGGLLLDLFSGAPLGVSSIGLVAAAYIAGLGKGEVTHKNVVLPPVMVLTGTGIYHVVTLVMLVGLGLHSPTWLDSLSYVTLPSAVLNFLLILPIFRLLGLLHARLYQRQKSVIS